MTERELEYELDRIVKDEYPLIASKYIDKEIMLKAARKISGLYEVEEWRGKDFPYRRLHGEFMGLIENQYQTTSRYDIFVKIGEDIIVKFLNDYYRWLFEEQESMSKELSKNNFNLSESDRKDFDKFMNNKPIPCKEPLDIAGYLHMCRIAYDAAPKFAYPVFISDLHVVGAAKFNSCRLSHRNMNEKMKVGDVVPYFMCYHPEEMGFGGPYVHFNWSDEGWIMCFHGKDRSSSKREVNMDIHRFLAMRRAGYPVEYAGVKPSLEAEYD